MVDLRECQVDVRRRWDEIRPRLARLSEEHGADWMPEDIFTLCCYGKGVMFLTPEGLMVVRPGFAEFGGEKSLFIVLAEGLGRVREIYQEALDRYAVEVGAKALLMHGTRKGWERAQGWSALYTVYQRRL